jgi:tRNA pseudouridine65 synthase
VRAVCPETPLEILHADAALVAVMKPAGLLVHRTGLARDADAFAVQRLRDQLGRPVYPAHRLDRATSGVLLFALERDIHARLAAAFESGAVDKRYLAIVRGWPPAALTIEHPLSRLDDEAEGPPRPATTRIVCLATAELDVRVDRYPTSRYALVAAEPLTGRRHQLRRHLKHAGHPIVGDTTYGQGRHNRLFRERLGSSRLLLHALGLRLAHPVSGAPLEIRAEPPEDFATVAAALGFAAALAAR